MRRDCRNDSFDGGFSLIEMIVVIAIMATILAIATPTFLQWRQKLVYRETAREVSSMLREAKSRAIANNVEQQVQFSPYKPSVSTQYGLRAGTRAYMSFADWSSVPAVSNWSRVDTQVQILSGALLVGGGDTNPAGSIQFTPNGAASSVGSIAVRDTNGTVQFYVNVAQTGRISITSGP